MERNRTHRIPGPAFDKIAELYVKGWTAAAIAKELEQTAWPVHFKTVQRIVREWRERDQGSRGPWSVRDAEDDEAHLVLPVWGAMLQELARVFPDPGRPDFMDSLRRLTISQARWIARVRRVVPDLPAAQVADVAMAYDRQELLGGSAHVLDEYLAFAPWRGEEQRVAYRAAIRAGWVQSVADLPSTRSTTEGLEQGADE